ncbi:hypothetical protein LSTR_LSTR004407 [Laodelphax striatellus]|uniref:Uncharacterized protein n=1 Tax=Laodelphax striatellus TaxID=195883 RepID=A0A482XAI8_LAOST|nr:hypothetical protein LSTR_LSTR004407 [Laodelphax striatellus]
MEIWHHATTRCWSLERSTREPVEVPTKYPALVIFALFLTLSPPPSPQITMLLAFSASLLFSKTSNGGGGGDSALFGLFLLIANISLLKSKLFHGQIYSVECTSICLRYSNPVLRSENVVAKGATSYLQKFKY